TANLKQFDVQGTPQFFVNGKKLGEGEVTPLQLDRALEPLLAPKPEPVHEEPKGKGKTRGKGKAKGESASEKKASSKSSKKGKASSKTEASAHGKTAAHHKPKKA